MGKKKIKTIKALNSIGIKGSDLRDLCGDYKRKELLLCWGIDPERYYPELARSISQEEWVKLLIFYGRRASHPPAQNLLRAQLEIVRKELYL
jgi:hypothetical protein